MGPVGLVGRLKPACAGGVGRPVVGVLRKKEKKIPLVCRRASRF